jgi:hypothetical protein
MMLMPSCMPQLRYRPSGSGEYQASPEPRPARGGARQVR